MEKRVAFDLAFDSGILSSPVILVYYGLPSFFTPSPVSGLANTIQSRSYFIHQSSMSTVHLGLAEVGRHICICRVDEDSRIRYEKAQRDKIVWQTIFNMLC